MSGDIRAALQPSLGSKANLAQSHMTAGPENVQPASASGAKKALSTSANQSDRRTSSAIIESELRSASEQYQKLSPRDHVLRRPDTYIGSIEPSQQTMWTYNSQTNAMQYTNVTLVPGLYKIFDEIIVNAADNKIRDPHMDTIKINFDRENNRASVYNNGKGIPIEIHATEKIWIPELIFGHLLTSSNYDDTAKKVTGGRNGYGAKLCNIFSKSFTVETADGKNKYVQTWTNNMSDKTKPKVTALKKPEQYTKVTFEPDLNKFGMENFDDDLESVLKRRVYDLAGCLRNVKVFLNDERIKIKSFKQYVELYLKSTQPEPQDGEASNSVSVVHEVVNDRWEVAFAVSDGQFNQVSFVNSIATTRGGTHVNYIADQITAKLIDAVKKLNKGGISIKPFQIKNHMWLFVNCLIENPAFDSQTKETLTLKPSAFGSKCPLSDDFIKKVTKTSVIENILNFARFKADEAMKKTDVKSRSRITGIPKLEDANLAGTKNGHKCTLILTEGDSAKTLAVAGLGIVGRDYYGVFPLRGKLLNVREATHQQIMNNAEIQAIKKIMGLQHGKVYENTEELRYGHLMIMTDQDHDGSHIKGLIINYFEKFYESLLRIPGFLIEFITPIVRVSKGREQIDFFTMPEVEYWKETHNNGAGWKFKYYKGLGTSDSSDARKYFSDLDRHLKEFHALRDEEKALVDMAFSKKKADDRKDWLQNFVPGTYMDHTVPKIPIDDFINKELILFSMADNVRSIPSVIDGLKPGQRKVIFGCFKRNLTQEVKVAQLQGYVAEHALYHHGEMSLMQTIIGLAQNFVGSNNINLLEPNGQFGSRLQGGKDSASPRYIHTVLSKITRKLMRSEDDPLLNYIDEEAQSIEPDKYVPILPLILINGSEGIGTGWSSYIPNYNPMDLVTNLKKMMNDEAPDELVPWYRGFKGEIVMNGDRFKSVGRVNVIDDTTIEITELPIRFWTQDMKEYLLAGLTGSEKSPAFIKDYSEYHTDTTVHFVVKLTDKGMAESLAEGLETRFKLVKSHSFQNMVAFNSEGRIKKYTTPVEILEEFYAVRLSLYQERKRYIMEDLRKQYEKLSNQARFVKMIVDDELVVNKKKREALVAELKTLGFKTYPKKAKQASSSDESNNETNLNEEADEIDDDNSFDYLLTMPISSLTYEKYQKLLQEQAKKQEQLEALAKLTIKEMWCSELDEFVAEWQKVLDRDEELRSHVSKVKPPTKKQGARARGKTKNSSSLDDDFVPKSKPKPKPKPKTQNNELKMKATDNFIDPEGASQFHVRQSSDSQLSTMTETATDIKSIPRKRTIFDDEDGDDDYLSTIVQSKRQNTSKAASTIQFNNSATSLSTVSSQSTKSSSAPSKPSNIVDSDVESSTQESKPAAKPRPKRPVKRSIYVESDSEEEDFENEESDFELEDDDD